MGRYAGPKARVNRRFGALIYENSGATRAAERREAPPGMHARSKRPSNYGTALKMKQKIKHYYGLGERQLRRNFENVRHKGGDIGLMLLQLCERRLDNVIRRAGFTKTRPQARQGVTHGHFQVNGDQSDQAVVPVAAGDVITVRNRENLLTAYRGLCDQSQGERLEWVMFDPDTLRATVQGTPGPSDISLPVDVNMVVEFLSR